MRERLILNSPERLTQPAHTSYARSIPMPEAPESTPATPVRPPEPAPRGSEGRQRGGIRRPASPQEQEALRKIWEEHYRRQGMDPDGLRAEERGTIDLMVEQGIRPKAGGAESVDTAGITETAFVDELRVLNSMLTSIPERDYDTEVEYLRKSLEKIMGARGITDETQRETLQRRISDQITDTERRKTAELIRRREEEGRASLYGERRLTEREKRNIIKGILDEEGNITEGDRTEKGKEYVERMFNRIFTRVDARQSDDFRGAFGTAGSIEYEEFLKVLIDAASGSEPLPDDIERTGETDSILRSKIIQYSQEYNLRESLHDANFYVLAGAGTEDFAKAANRFQAQWADLAYSKSGVVQIAHFYEQAMLEVMAKYGGYLPNITMIDRPLERRTEEQRLAEEHVGQYGEVEALVRDRIKTAQAAGVLDRDMKDWEVDRAISLARGMGIMTGRSIEIAAMSRLPSKNELVSLYAQDIIKDIAPFRHLYIKYNLGQERNRILAFFMEGRKGKPKTVEEHLNFIATIKDAISKGKVLGGWSKEELEELKQLSAAEIMSKMVQDSGDDRYVDVLNPFEVGGMFSITGWRYRDDASDMQREALATMIGHLLRGNRYNTILGAGMWIEKERGNLGSKEEIPEEERDVYGHHCRTKGERAEVIIRHNLELAAKIAPLKLLYNLPELRTAVLGAERISAETQSDLALLGVVQEKSQRQRVEAYKQNVLDENPAGALPEELDYSFITDDVQRARVQQLAQRIHNTFFESMGSGRPSHFERFIDNLKNRVWKKPYILGQDDIPYDLYNFAAAGATSIARRWRDINAVRTASNGMTKLINSMDTFQDDEKIIEVMREIYDGISGSDETAARRAMVRIAEGIIKFYKKDWEYRLPAGIGTALGIATGRASYAQAAFGRGAMAWDELDIWDFIRDLRQAGMLPTGAEGEKTVDQLKKRVGGKWGNLTYAIGRTATPLLVLAFAYYMLNRLQEEK